MEDIIRLEPKKSKRVNPMTVCLSLICDAGNGVPMLVLCADRMVTSGEGLTYEQNRPKIVLASQKCINCAVLYAGDGNNADTIILRMSQILDKEASKGKIFTIMEISELMKSEMKKLRNEKINSELLSQSNLDMSSFYSNLKKYPDWFGKGLDKKIRNYSLGVHFLVVGFDLVENGTKYLTHINFIGENGEIKVLDADGFGIIGIGNIMSFPEITKDAYKLNTPLSDAIVKVYWAKKSAERVVSVGSKNTDLVLMRCVTGQDGKIMVFSNLLADSFIKELEKNYDESNKKMKDAILEIEKNIDDVFSGKKTLAIG